MAVSFVGIIALVLMGGAGSYFRDLVSAFSVEDYFAYRGVEVKPEEMLKLAQKTPADARDGIAQLLAIRWLGEKRVQAAREPLEQIAQGKLGPDPHGFARDYARWSLARLIDKPPPEHGPPKDSLREALRWFPEEVTFFGALDLHGLAGLQAVPEEELRALLAKVMPREIKHEVYKFADAVGNIRIDRVSFGTALDGQERKKGRIYVRISGRGDHKRVSSFLRDLAVTTAFKQEAGPDGELITILSHPARAPAFALIGNTEMLLAGYEGEENALEVLEQALAVRNGKPSVLQGVAAKGLAQVSPKAAGFVAGSVPAALRRELSGPPRLPALPRQVHLELLAEKGLRFQLRATMESEADAQKLASAVEALKPEVIRAIKDLGLKPELARTLTQVIENLTLKAEGASVNGSIQISNEAMKALGAWFMSFARAIE